MALWLLDVFILFDTQLTGYQTSFIAARKVIDTEMRAIESNIFWCFVERLAQINNRAVFVSATNEIINQCFLVFFTNKVIKYYYLLASSSFNSFTGIISSLLQTRTLYPTLFDISVNVCSISLYFCCSKYLAYKCILS